MRGETILDLAECGEFRQALQARPPRVVHGTLALALALLGSALAWAALTEASLVVEGPGRVRPVTAPVKAYNAARGEALSATAGGRVVEVFAREGDLVRRGDVLVRLDTAKLDSEMAKLRRAIRSGDEELARLDRLENLLERQSAAASAKHDADLTRARDELRRASERREAEIRLARIALAAAEQEEASSRKLASRGVVAPAGLLQTVTKTREARERLALAEIPVDPGGVEAAARALELAERDHALKREELALKRGAKRGEVESARIELASLEREREQAEIRSPIDGVVTAGDLKPGDVVASGRPVAEVARRGGFRFEASVPSEDVGHLRVGMPARIKVDAFDHQRYGTLEGTVAFLSPDSEPSGTGGGVVYTVRIDLPRDELIQGDLRARVKLGMGGKAEIITGRSSLLTLLARRTRQTISLN